MLKYLGLIKKAPIFAGVSEKELSALLKCLGATISTYSKGEMIFLVGSPASSVGVVCDGTAQVIREDIFGNRSIIDQINAGNLFGETFACAKTTYLPVGVEALSDSVVLMINLRKIITTCSSSCVFHNKLIENMLKVVAEKNLILNQKIEVLSARSTREKILTYLNRQAVKKGSDSFNIPFNRQELADFLSVDRSAMSAELGRMRDEGIISFHKNSFKLF